MDGDNRNMNFDRERVGIILVTQFLLVGGGTWSNISGGRV